MVACSCEWKKCIYAHVGNLIVDCGSTQTECAQFMCAKEKLKPLTAYDQFESYVLTVVVQVSVEMTVDVFVCGTG